MPGQPKYCVECKGYGDLYEQTITRYGDKRIKVRTPIEAKACSTCKGTGMITLQSDKKPSFDVNDELVKPIIDETVDDLVYSDDAEAEYDAQDELQDALDEEIVEAKAVTDEEMQHENDALDSDEIAEKSNDDLVFKPKHIEPADGEMPL